MAAQTALATGLDRRPPPMGGFSPAIVRLEVRRLLRNRRTMILALIVPVVFFVAFGLNTPTCTRAVTATSRPRS